ADTAFVVQYFALPAEEAPLPTPAPEPTVTAHDVPTVPVLPDEPMPSASDMPPPPPRPTSPAPAIVVNTSAPTPSPSPADLTNQDSPSVPSPTPPPDDEPSSSSTVVEAISNPYGFDTPPVQEKVLGIATPDDLGAWIRNIYVALLTLLTASLLLALAVRFKVHHIGTIAHAMAVIGFTTTLMLWS
ncbi:hypothetical protein L0Y59_00100, partial [Candidatus Uhrbacteria bacterium]|nr:hypothetical protein [Candidatus Uhrbacteria bacterium]